MRITFKNKKIESIAKKIDAVALFMVTPINNKIFPKSWKISLNDMVLYTAVSLVSLSYGCTPEESKTPEQQVITEVPAIKVVNNRLFVDDKEMQASEFIKKYCFAKQDNQTCVEAHTVSRIQNNHTTVVFPKDF
jgi:hypothetical protein